MPNLRFAAPVERRVAIVTGGARGIGRATALRMAEAGRDIVIADLQDEHGASAVAEIEALGQKALYLPTDVTDEAAVHEMVAKSVATFGRLDILVNNAGGMLHPPAQTSAATAPEDHYRYIMDINLTSTVFCCQAASRPMIAAGSGRIVNVGSQAGLWSGRSGGGMAYKVAKAGIIHYTRVLAAELGPHGVNVNCIAPGWILSSRALASGRNSDETRARLEPDIPLGRLGWPEDCAKVVEFLVTDLSDYVTGQCIPVDGGYIAF